MGFLRVKTDVDAPRRIDELESIDACQDDLLIIFASPEERCLGIARRLSRYCARSVALIAISDEPNERRTANLAKLHELCAGSTIKLFDYKHADCVFGISELARFVYELSAGKDLNISIDISTFPEIRCFSHWHLLRGCLSAKTFDCCILNH